MCRPEIDTSMFTLDFKRSNSHIPPWGVVLHIGVGQERKRTGDWSKSV